MDLEGTNDTSSNLSVTHVNFTQSAGPTTEASCPVREQLSKLWDIESLGLISNDSVYNEFKENVVYNGECYQVTLPFREGRPLVIRQLPLEQTEIEVIIESP